MRSSLVVALCLLASPAGAQTIASRRETTPYPGVRVIEGRTSNPTTDFWAALVSLCTDYVHVTATPPPSALRVTSAWASGAGVQVATNGDFFATGPRVYGYAVGGGRAWPVRQTGTDPAVAGEWYYRRYGWIAFGPGTVEFSHTEWVKERAAMLRVREGWMPTTVTTAVPRGLTQLVSGFPELVTEGTRYACASPTASTCFPDRSDMRARHPRTAMGLTRDRRTFLLVAVDGRSTRSAGMYGTELARLMELLGAWQAFNLDGGGSTTFWQRGRGVLNRPSDGSERAVANHWGIFAGSASGRPRAAGSCYVAPVADAGVRDAALDAPSDAPRPDVPPPRDAPAPRDVAIDRSVALDVARDVLAEVVAEDAGLDAPEVVDEAPFDGGDDDAEEPPGFVDADRADAPPADADPDPVAAPQPGCACRAAPTRGASGAGLSFVAVMTVALCRRARQRGASSRCVGVT